MKKILLVMPISTFEWGSKNAGGVDSVCQMLIKFLSENPSEKFHYRVMAFDPFCSNEYTGEVIRLSGNLEVVTCPANEKRWGVKWPGVVSTYLRVRAEIKCYQPDIVHSHIASWLLGVPKSCRRILTLHSYKNICRKPVSWANDFLYVELMPWMSNLYVDSYTCVSEMLKKALVKNIDKPVTVIGNPIDDAYFVALDRRIETGGVLRLVTCALINRRKRIDLAINLVKALKSAGKKVHLSIIGPNVDQAYFMELEKQVAELELNNEVSFLERLNRGEIIREYQSADIGVFFSEQETFGLAPLEMLATGLPLLTTEVGILAERREAFQRLEVEYVNTDTQVRAIEKLQEVNSVEAHRYLEVEFSAASVVSAYEALYTES
ncbi:VpsD family glycosyltransferase [Photobacterium sagamiensis]|uniref:VpsD family glycosyltransferase n=1 Tax=Photobacterium sagamiensis TaxID=2910241 RepID=UPI003D1201A1